MNKLFIIGNLTRDPELRSTLDGIAVCSFTVAVNRRSKGAQAGKQDADFFRVNAWRELGETCAKYLAKGRKVAVTGPVSVSTYTAQNGETRANLEVTADNVEFLTTAADTAPAQPAPEPQPQQPSSGFEEVSDDDLPF
jgi:single-strand DNA-binding protein